MSGRIDYKYKKDWFVKNLTPVPAGIIGNCSACVFRNAPVYCAKMSCTYCDNETDFMETVYWRANQTHANIATWSELRQWFESTPSRKIMDISNDVLTNEVLKQKSR